MSATDTDGVVGGRHPGAHGHGDTDDGREDRGDILVGHVTKDGAIAGPRSLEHLVDVVLHSRATATARLDGPGVKNRFGAADEVGCFLMHDGWIRRPCDPSGLVLAEQWPSRCPVPR